MPYFINKYKKYNIANLDLLTYVEDLVNLKEVKNNPRYKFIVGWKADKNLDSGIIKTIAWYLKKYGGSV